MPEFIVAGLDAEVYSIAKTTTLNRILGPGTNMPKDSLHFDDYLVTQDQNDYTCGAKSDAGYITEIAAKLCYDSYRSGRSNHQKFMDNIIQSGHGSVLEHTSWTFLFTGVSRTFTHELVRHRAGFAYSQLSQRYVDESEARFIIPEAIANTDEDDELNWFKTSIDESVKSYKALVHNLMASLEHIEDRTLRRKTARGAARSVLPNCTETKIVVTANARAWRHFISMRGSIHADAEIRHVALKVLKILQQDAPSLFNDYEIKNIDGIDCAESPWPKI